MLNDKIVRGKRRGKLPVHLYSEPQVLALLAYSETATARQPVARQKNVSDIWDTTIQNLGLNHPLAQPLLEPPPERKQRNYLPGKPIQLTKEQEQLKRVTSEYLDGIIKATIQLVKTGIISHYETYSSQKLQKNNIDIYWRIIQVATDLWNKIKDSLQEKNPQRQISPKNLEYLTFGDALQILRLLSDYLKKYRTNLYDFTRALDNSE
ncbi:hypothetical protein HYU92_05145 [Candidatus Curtissbacteria bacterium]|nr:hypothetical protein [Candidatus Curtissbacteria bacterium]